MPTPSTPAQYLLILIDMVQREGHDQALILAGSSFSGSGTGGVGARVSEGDFDVIAGNALRLTGDAALGLKAGLRINLSAHATLGQAFMTCRDLGEVMDLFIRYYHLLAPGLQLEFDTVEDRCVLAIAGGTREQEEVFFHELLFGAIVNTLRGLLNQPGLRVRVELPYPAPDHVALYREVFGEEVFFDRIQARLSFPTPLLATPLPSSNPPLRALYEAECARLLADLEETASVAEQTLRLLRKLEGQYPQMPQLAAMLNFSPRTYRRRLEQENRSYQSLLDGVRAEHATRYLRNTRLPLSSIAYLVGFNDASNFRRAYLKWTGNSPGAVRRGA